jgi:predicted transcriptional regulator
MRTVVEKVVEYLMTHKKSSTVKQLAKYFIVSEGSVSRALCDLVKEQKVERIQSTWKPNKLPMDLAPRFSCTQAG